MATKKTNKSKRVLPTKFAQITTGEWGGNQHTLYGLGFNGKVYRWYMYEGWVEMEPKDRDLRYEEDPQ